MQIFLKNAREIKNIFTCYKYLIAHLVKKNLDKAIDDIDKVCTCVRLSHSQEPENIEKVVIDGITRKEVVANMAQVASQRISHNDSAFFRFGGDATILSLGKSD